MQAAGWALLVVHGALLLVPVPFGTEPAGRGPEWASPMTDVGAVGTAVALLTGTALIVIGSLRAAGKCR